ncbi:hypothetical protein [Nemorincola caseinilytica]
MAEAGMKGLALFNAIKKLQNEGRITVEGEGADATYTLNETEASHETPTENGEEQVPQEQEELIEPIQQVEERVARSAGRDNTKYKFNGQEYGKGPLVLAVVKKYVEDNPDTTFKQLKEVFPDTLMPRWHVFRNEQEAIALSAKKPRYFLKQPIKLKGQKEPILVTNQWTAALIDKFLPVIKSVGYKVR